MAEPVMQLNDLRTTYCPPLDETVFLAIASDYDLSDDDRIFELRQILDSLKEAALVQEAADLDHSGRNREESEDINKSRTTPEERSTDVTSVTSDLADLGLGDGEAISGQLEHLPQDEKIKWLKNLFPNAKTEHIRQSLQVSTSLEQTVDELLSLAFIGVNGDDEEGHVKQVSGIDGFAEDLRPQKRKGRSKKKNKASDSPKDDSVDSYYRAESPVSGNVWDSLSDDINFICARTSLQPQVVRSIYHSKGTKLSTTIRALADREGAGWHKTADLNFLVQAQVLAIKEDYPTVSEAHIYGLLTLARNIPSATSELIDAMLRNSDMDIGPRGKLQGVVQYSPVDIKALEETVPQKDHHWTTVQHGTTVNGQKHAIHGMAASDAFSQASGAYRRSKSDRLMGGAATYYASVGHEHVKAAKLHQAMAAESHVASQSSSTMLDLHGVSVEQAVRIARAGTQAWFDGLGEAKYARGGGGPLRAGYRIVTGTGTHSKSHIPRIGPAVFKMLVRENWKAQAFSGEIMVYGKK